MENREMQNIHRLSTLSTGKHTFFVENGKNIFTKEKKP